MSIPLKFTIDIERNKKLSEILTTLKNIPELMLEPNHVSKDVDEISTKAVNKEEVNDCTSFAITNNPDFFLDPNSEIETYLSRNDTITFFVYEMLNAKGMNELLFKQINEEKKEEEISTNVIKNSENNCCACFFVISSIRIFMFTLFAVPIIKNPFITIIFISYHIVHIL